MKHTLKTLFNDIIDSVKSTDMDEPQRKQLIDDIDILFGFVEEKLRQRKRDIYAKFPKTDEAVISIDELLGDAE